MEGGERDGGGRRMKGGEREREGSEREGRQVRDRWTDQRRMDRSERCFCCGVSGSLTTLSSGTVRLSVHS